MKTSIRIRPMRFTRHRPSAVYVGSTMRILSSRVLIASIAIRPPRASVCRLMSSSGVVAVSPPELAQLAREIGRRGATRLRPRHKELYQIPPTLMARLDGQYGG